MALVKISRETARGMHARTWRALVVQAPHAPERAVTLFFEAHRCSAVVERLASQGRDFIEVVMFGFLMFGIERGRTDIISSLTRGELLVVGSVDDLTPDFDRVSPVADA